MKDVLISNFCNRYFILGFKTYFNELNISVKEWDELFESMNNDGDNYAYIRLTDDNDIIGFIQFKIIELSNWFFSLKTGFIREFWVDKEYRCMKHGSALLQLAEDYFIESRLHKSILTTDTANIFYESRGYKKHVDIISQNGDDVYVKDLN